MNDGPVQNPFEDTPSISAPTPEVKREPMSPKGSLRLGVMLYIVLNAAYGVPILIWPDLLWKTVGGADSTTVIEALRSMRWAGAILCVMAVGGLMVLPRLKGQRTFVTVMALQLTVAGAALWFSVFTGEFDYLAAWFPIVSAIVVSLAGLYVWMARWRGRELLGV